MATLTAIPQVTKPKPSSVLRIRMEELLMDFYSVVGVAPRRPYPVNAADLLASDFEGQFFIQTTSELMVFSKAQMLASKVGRGELQRPTCQMLSMSATREEDGVVGVIYAAAFRFGQTAQVRRGSFKAARENGQWVLRSIDEDVRLVFLPEVCKKRVAADRPRVWVL